MKRNTILMTAVWIALGSAGAASAQTSEECTTQATQLKAQIEASTLADSDRAKLENSLSEAQTADVARCQQIVSRVSRDLTAGAKAGIVNPDTGSDYSSTKSSKPASEPSKQPSTTDQTSATSPKAEQPDYEEGHAAAAESLPTSPGAADTTTDPASTTMQDEGYSSAQQTIPGSETPSDTSGGASTDTTGSTEEITSDEAAAAAGGARMSSDEAQQTAEQATPSGTASSALASMTTKDLVDKPVKATNGKEVGEIDSVVIDRTPEGHGFAVVSVGGLLGLGETKVVVDLDKLQLTADGSIQAQVADEDEIKGYTRYNEAHYQQYQGDLSRLM
jgi:sporulation protein YlmC with PRC-barrel domain